MVLFSAVLLIFCLISVVKGGETNNEWDYAGPPLHAVSIQYHTESDNFRHFCTGSLITFKWILTAASCFDNIDHGTIIYALLGVRKVDQYQEPAQFIEVVQTDIHPSYEPGYIAHDIALLKLASEAILNYYVQTISIPRIGSYLDYAIGLVYGWGPFQNESNEPMSAIARIFPGEDCSHYFDPKKLSNVNCVGKEPFYPGICGGTPGIPISRFDVVTGKYVLAIASYWPENCIYPPLFTSVLPYRDFILEHIRNDEYDDY